MGYLQAFARYALLKNTSFMPCCMHYMYFKHSSIDALSGYTPFHPDVDIESRMLLDTDATTRTADLSIESTNDEPFIVERVLQKHFHPQRQQYEFLVKWRGYADAENTRELLSNIPDEKIQDFDRQQQQVMRPASRREGLRESQLKSSC